MLWGAIVGDIVGSVYEWDNIKTKVFPLFAAGCSVTDDTCMTVAVARALLDWRADGGDLSALAVRAMRDIGHRYPDMGYGTMFCSWLYDVDATPYNSYGNGAAMRISAAGWVGKSTSDVKRMSYMLTSPTHNHIEGIKGAEATAVAVFMARTGSDKSEIEHVIRRDYYPNCPSVAELNETYEWDSSCQGTVPQALQCFFESSDFEDAIRNAISIGGDSDTIGAITGAVAGAYYGVPDEIRNTAAQYVPNYLMKIITQFETEIG